MKFLRATVTYKGYDLEKDKEIKKGFIPIVESCTGSGYLLTEGERDIGFKIKEENKTIFEETIKLLKGFKGLKTIKVSFSEWED